MGAWIETLLILALEHTMTSHPTWVRGLKPDMAGDDEPVLQSHPTWVRGLKHQHGELVFGLAEVAPHVGAWIETATLDSNCLPWLVAPHVGAWIETQESVKKMKEVRVAPHVGAWIETFCRRGCAGK